MWWCGIRAAATPGTPLSTIWANSPCTCSPSGVFRPGVMNILGNGVALDCENLVTEMETIRAAGVSISPENLMVSHRASLLLPWHRELDALEEARLKDKMYGSTKQGIAPFYSDKYQKKDHSGR